MKPERRGGMTSPTGFSTGMDGYSHFVTKFLPDEQITIRDKTVHIWLASLNLKATQLLELWRTLAPAERERALRFRSQKDCDRFTAARGLLRTLLGHYLQRQPAQIEFCYNAHGKPALADNGGTAPLQFNLSHSSEFALFAFARARRLGVDIEYIRPHIVEEDIAGHFFSPTEVKALRALPERLRQKAFFACWTRKEAYIKARGEGLSLPLHEFDVSLAPNKPARLLKVNNSPDEAARWSLHELLSGPDYVAALAVEGHDCQFEHWRWVQTGERRETT